MPLQGYAWRRCCSHCCCHRVRQLPARVRAPQAACRCPSCQRCLLPGLPAHARPAWPPGGMRRPCPPPPCQPSLSSLACWFVQPSILTSLSAPDCTPPPRPPSPTHPTPPPPPAPTSHPSHPPPLQPHHGPVPGLRLRGAAGAGVGSCSGALGLPAAGAGTHLQQLTGGSALPQGAARGGTSHGPMWVKPWGPGLASAGQRPGCSRTPPLPGVCHSHPAW